MAASDGCMVLQAIYSSMKSLLGPNKCLKCYMSGTTPEQENAILGDAMQVLDALMSRIEHPVGQLLYDTCLTHQKLYGNGVTTIVCMACFWLREKQTLIVEGIPCPVIFALFEEALQVCEDVLGTSSISLDMVHKHYREELEMTSAELHQQNVGKHAAGVINVGAQYAGTSLEGTHSSNKGNKIIKAAGKTSLTNRNVDAVPAGKVSLHNTFGSMGIVAAGKSGRVSTQKARVLLFSRHFRPSGTAAIKISAASEPDPETAMTCPTEDKICGGDRYSPGFVQFVGSKLAHGREFAMSLAVRAVELQTQGQRLLPDCNLVFIHCLLGASHTCSEVLPGAVVSLEPEMSSAAHSLKGPVRILVVCGDATSSFSHIGLKRDVSLQYHVASHDLKLLQEGSHMSEWLESCAALIEKYQIGMLAVEGSVCPPLWDYCLARGVVVARHLTHTQCQLLCTTSAGEPVHYISQCTERHVGEVLLQTVESGWSTRRKGEKLRTHYCIIRPVQSKSVKIVCTAVLCGKTKDYVDLLKQQLLNCLWRLRCVFEDGYVLPGGGLTEAVCVREIQKRCSDCSNVKSPPFSMATTWMADFLPQCRQRVFQAFHEGLKLFISTTLMNSEPGMSVFEARTAAERMVVGQEVILKATHVQVFDLKQSKYEGWLKAYHLARLMVQTQH